MVNHNKFEGHLTNALEASEKQHKENIVQLFKERGLDKFITPDIAEKLVVLDIIEKSTGRERSHATDIAELIDMAETVRKGVQAGDVKLPEAMIPHDDEWEALKAGFLFQDMGKAVSQSVSELYALNDKPAQNSIGDAMKKIGENFFEQYKDEIRSFIVEAKTIMECRNAPDTDCGAVKKKWETELADLESPKAKRRYFFDIHSYFSLKTLENNKEALINNGISEDTFAILRRVAGAHHTLEGNALIPDKNIGIFAMWGEFIDKLHAGMTRFGDQEASPEDRWEDSWEFIMDRIDRFPDGELKNRYETLANALKPELKTSLLPLFT